MDLKEIEKINKLAKVLKENKLAASMDDAVKQATEMIKNSQESLEELEAKESLPGAEELVKEEPGFIEKTKDVFEKREEIPHIVPSKKEVVKEIDEEIQEIREEIKKQKQEKNIKPDMIKEKVEEAKEEEKELEKEEGEEEE